jgi:hypothetical protein
MTTMPCGLGRLIVGAAFHGRPGSPLLQLLAASRGVLYGLQSLAIP